MKIVTSIIWYFASIMIIYLSGLGIKKYGFIGFHFKDIMFSFKEKSQNVLSLTMSLAGKIGVGSIAGVALAIYYGGVGTIFWMIIISFFLAINTYIECLLGMKYRIKKDDNYYGGPSYYIENGLGLKGLSRLYGIILIISYSVFFLSIQVSSINGITKLIDINTFIVMFLVFLSVFLVINRGVKSIFIMNYRIVPLMLIIYLLLGIYVIICNYYLIPGIIVSVMKSAFNIRSILPVIIIAIERVIFITESNLGTSAISVASSNGDPHKQANLEIFGNYLIIFIISVITFFIITTSDYLSYRCVNGVDLVMHAFYYHFGYMGKYYLGIITFLFAYSTIISSYFFVLSNIHIFNNGFIKKLYKPLFLVVMIMANFIKPLLLWQYGDIFLAILVIINTYSIILMIRKKLI